MMLGAVFAYTFAVRLGWPFALAAAMSLLLCALYGLVVELLAVRPFASRGSNAWLMATVALGIIADNSVLFTFGKEPRGLALPSASASLEIAGLHVSMLQLAIPAGGNARSPAVLTVFLKGRLGQTRLARVQEA